MRDGDAMTRLGRAAAAVGIAVAMLLGTAAGARAVFGGERMLFRGPREPTKPQERTREPENERAPEVGLTEREARPLVTSYYASHGQWAGQYVIDRIPRMGFVQRGPHRIHAHVRYRYRCVLDRCGGAMQTGYDQRVFYLERRGGEWEVVWMGGYMSADMR